MQCKLQQIERVVATPLSDSDIREYLPDARIFKYSELSKYPELSDLLPDVKSYCILLYEDSPNKGHWVVVSKPTEDTVEYFDSYGGYVDEPLNWTSKAERVQLGSDKKLLSKLFNKAPEQVVWNKIKYQKASPSVNDCGRWCILRTLKMKAGMDLDQFYDYVKKEDSKYIGDKDHFVSQIVP
jgi:hypothetical protein